MTSFCLFSQVQGNFTWLSHFPRSLWGRKDHSVWTLEVYKGSFIVPLFE